MRLAAVLTCLTLACPPFQAVAGTAATDPNQEPPQNAHGVPRRACSQDADLSGMLDALDALAVKLTGLDAILVKDGADTIRDYQEVRKRLCQRLDEASEIEASLRDSIKTRDAILAVKLADIATLRKAWEDSMAHPIQTPKRGAFGFLFGVCVSTPILGDPEDDVQITGSGCWGLRL